ncbi:ATPase, AAA family [Dictyocaulus viviparus]|uniref:ATPase, AAA family n=1 Tax=Dictyocaulus viviparus TaxID=29172 RepID=A0A0D8Y1G3_DICVI|nr:ATPase, AAA family [Dictyocaulus viviparus]
MVNVRKLRQNSIICNSDGAANDSNLWVKKYSPRFYTDLLSDDGVNRHLMSWVKLWDECVFKRKTVDVPNIGFVKERGILTLDTGKLRRPNYKLALLSGRAGLGKTTLAKIVAQQAGYATVELNASDSRNVADFEKVLEGAVYTSRTLDRNSRPSCLILDEIDGAPVESIRFLVKAVNSTGKKAIRRPIICICNNMYTSALRELRAIALNIQLNPTSEKRLIQRLIAIAEAENVQIDSFAVRRLAELCQCDVRFAINTMQRLSTLAKGEGRSISVDDIEKIVEREKVGSLSIFEDWSTILDFTHHFDRQGILLPLPERLRLVERVGIERGDDRFVSGLYENCLSANLPLKAVRAGVEAFVFYDHIMYVINNKQNYVFLKYVGIFYMLLHAAMASHTRAKLKYPHLEQTANQRHRESQETLATVHGNLFGRHSPTALVSDVLPLLVQIVQPYIKAMNQQLYSSRDLDSIENAVSIMADYHLTFTPAVVNSVPHYLFQPSIDVLTMFAISDVSSRNFLTNSAREMIAHKILLLHTTGRTVNENAEPKSNTLQIKQIVDNAHALKSHAEGPIRPLFYKFNMGSSTAVKRTIRMHQLLI